MFSYLSHVCEPNPSRLKKFIPSRLSEHDIKDHQRHCQKVHVACAVVRVSTCRPVHSCHVQLCQCLLVGLDTHAVCAACIPDSLLFLLLSPLGSSLASGFPGRLLWQLCVLVSLRAACQGVLSVLAFMIVSPHDRHAAGCGHYYYSALGLWVWRRH